MKNKQLPKYSIIMYTKLNGLVKLFMRETGLKFREALAFIYNSQVFATLEDESTKIWHYSEILLFDLLMQEKATGKVDYPDV
ncbi:MAG: hypothetical protein FWE23_05855 [Chitinivibrionia bacterium]|nr:hypothetical protein [Chitinivibrionia bacterium]